MEEYRYIGDDGQEYIKLKPPRTKPFTVEPCKAKVVMTGHVIEVYRFERPFWLRAKGLKSWRGGRKSKAEKEEMEAQGIEYERDLAVRRNTKNKAKNTIRRLALANFDEHSKFVTLTFRDGSIGDVTNIDDANREFKKFIQRLRRRFGDFGYIAVIEFQDETGRGAVHYHMLSDLPYIPNDELAEIWGNGFVKINDITRVDNIGAYMVKYMSKSVEDTRLRGRKSFLTSRKLKKPEVLYSEDAIEIHSALKESKKKEVYADTYTSEYCGQIRYKEYNTKR